MPMLRGPPSHATTGLLSLGLLLLLAVRELFQNNSLYLAHSTRRLHVQHSEPVKSAEDISFVPRGQRPPSPLVQVLPGFCDFCGSEDVLCAKYGEGSLARSRSYEGTNTRLKRVMRKARAGGKVKIGVLGGSVSHGHGVEEDFVWSRLYVDWWKAMFPRSEISFSNGASPAVESDYFQTCFAEHMDEDVDLVLVEMAINDRRLEPLAESYEYLLRALLELPNQPAVINVQVLALAFDAISMGGDLHTAVANYYDTPVISVRNMLLPHLLKHPELQPIPLIDPDLADQPNWSAIDLDHYWFVSEDWVDYRHLNANGHSLVAELLESYSERVLCSVMRQDTRGYKSSRPADNSLPGEDVLDYVPRLRLFDKYDKTTMRPPTRPTCKTVTSLRNPLVPLIALTSGWRYWNPPQRPDKIYLRATEPGAVIAFDIRVGIMGEVRVTYLRSKTFGMGSVWCWIDDDRNVGTPLHGWWDVEGINSAGGQVVARHIAPGTHRLFCELLEETKDPGGGHDFRITAVDAS